ncbi:MAG: Lysine decarboxylase family protein [Parcubacteria group bacterium GW2011_GWA2_47_16]|nr:MAG: Lysine decarboxylase family protein [Parcubacteria group bacterium GW2011_GWA2_47_16]
MEENKNELLPAQISKQEIHRIIKSKVHRIDRELTEGFEFINKYEKSVTFFGSARFTENNPHYTRARELARKISELGYAILTGGGGGIMEGANRGAFEAGHESLGLNIRLLKEQDLNPYITDSIEFNYFFVRKVAMSFAAEAYIFFPGGFGTMDELFEILTLIQTRKIRRIPIILVGSDYWNELHSFIKKEMFSKHRTIDVSDMDIYTITDNDEEIIEIIKKVPVKTVVSSHNQLQ